MEFKEFQKIPRLSREVVITEKIDGTNAQISIGTFGVGLYEMPRLNWPYTYAKEVNGGTTFIFAGSRNRWITPGKNTDNSGFASWVKENGEELLKLGEGRHYGEWWGKGIQRGYDLKEKRFSLFNISRWTSEFNEMEDLDIRKSTICNEVPICHVVPLVARIMFDTHHIEILLDTMRMVGSYAAPYFKRPEGFVIYHTAGGYYFKKTIERDESPKSLVKGNK